VTINMSARFWFAENAYKVAVPVRVYPTEILQHIAFFPCRLRPRQSDTRWPDSRINIWLIVSIEM